MTARAPAVPVDFETVFRASFQRFQEDLFHPSLRFKCIDHEDGTWSARISIGYRALGTRDDDHIIWFWIGSHAAYDKIV